MLRLTDLTGPADGPAVPVPASVDAHIERLGASLGVDSFALLVERAEIWSYTRNGRTSCGGATRLLRAADGWIAVTLARADDEDLVPAWIGTDASWPAIESKVATVAAAEVVARGRLLGLPVARVGERAPGPPYIATAVGSAPPLDRAPVVVDLSSLWAGPLCTRLLRDMGMHVVKVESRSRPDGARRGPQAFFDRMHAGKELVTIDFTRDALQPLVDRADIVVEGSRPRALDQLGIDRSPPRVWLSITGHGTDDPARDWVGFGDDCAVAGGLVAYDGDGDPWFLGDAIADPLTGMFAARAVRDAIAAGGRWVVDCNLAGAAAYVAAPDT